MQLYQLIFVICISILGLYGSITYLEDNMMLSYFSGLAIGVVSRMIIE